MYGGDLFLFQGRRLDSSMLGKINVRVDYIYENSFCFGVQNYGSLEYSKFCHGDNVDIPFWGGQPGE